VPGTKQNGSVEPYPDEAAGNSAQAISSGRIDVHAHFVPPEWHELPAAAAPLFRGFTSWSVPSALEMMDRRGIAAAVLTTALWTGLFTDADDASAARRFARSSNEVAAEAIRSHPDRFGGFASIPLPDVDDALAEIDYGLGTLGLDGVVLLTNAGGVYPGDSRLDPVFDELSRRRAVVFLHPTLPACAGRTSLGYAPALIEFVFDTTRAVTHLILSGTLERCPDMRLIVPHAGGTIPFLADRIDLLASRMAPGAMDRAPAGVKAYLRKLYYELAISTSPHAVASVLQLADPERILFGTDFPALSEEDVKGLIQGLAGNPLLQRADLEMIERRNALQLFPRLRHPASAAG
jgi:predicted TIM-barrel fold metal-dependent hydrolase